MITDDQFSQWLVSATRDPVVLLEVDHVVEEPSGPATRLLCFCRSRAPYVSDITDTPASQAYQDRIKVGGIPVFTQSLDLQNLGGEISGSFGIATFNNADGGMNTYLTYAVDGSAVRLYLGDASWKKADFRLVFSGIATVWGVDGPEVSLAIEDASSALGKTISGGLIGDDGFATTEQAGVPCPLVLGAVHNMSVVLERKVPTLDYRYSKSDGGYTKLLYFVREGGNDIAGNWADNQDGRVTLLASPTLELTADAFRPDDIVNFDTYRASNIFHLLAYELAGLGAAGLYYGPHSSFTPLDDNDPHIGWLVTSETPIRDVVGKVAMSANAFYGHRRDNTFQFGRIFPYNPQGVARKILTDDDMLRGRDGTSQPSVISFLAPKYSQVNALGDKNWHQQTNLATALDPALKARYQRDGLHYSTPDPDSVAGTTYAEAPWLFHKSMVRSEVLETAISASFDTDSLGTAELARFSETLFNKFLPWVCLHRQVWHFKTFDLEIGDVVDLSDSWHGLTNVKSQVVQRKTDTENEAVELTLAYRNPAGGPSAGAGSFLLQLNGDYILQLDASSKLNVV